MLKAGKRAIILDSSAFLAGYDPLSIDKEQYTVPIVRREIVKSQLSWVRFKTAMEIGRLRLRTPDRTSVDNVITSAKEVGDAFFLSEVDLQVLALALELKREGYKTTIATDDYSIQNVANHMGVNYIPLATFGIKLRLRWIRYCPACRRKYSATYNSVECEVCGTKLKRKPLK